MLLVLIQKVSKLVRKIGRDLLEKRTDPSCWGILFIFGLTFQVNSFDVVSLDKRSRGKLFYARLHKLKKFVRFVASDADHARGVKG